MFSVLRERAIPPEVADAARTASNVIHDVTTATDRLGKKLWKRILKKPVHVKIYDGEACSFVFSRCFFFTIKDFNL